MYWFPDGVRVSPAPLGYDIWRTQGFYFPFVTELVMVLSHTLQVKNFDFQRSSANMIGFLISYNQEYCDSLEFADSKDLFEPNKKYPDDEKMAESIRAKNGVYRNLSTNFKVLPKCLVNFNRTSKCLNERNYARRDGSDVDQIMKFNPACFEDRITVGSILQTLDSTDNNGHSVLDSLNPNLNKTYRATGMHIQVKLSYTNEDIVVVRSRSRRLFYDLHHLFPTQPLRE